MSIINALFKDVNKFVADQDQDLEFLVKFVDYILAEVDLDISSEEEVQSYMQSIQIVNNLYKLLGLTTYMSDKERIAYDNSKVGDLIDNPERLLKLKEFKTKIHLSTNEDLIPLFETYREGKF